MAKALSVQVVCHEGDGPTQAAWQHAVSSGSPVGAGDVLSRRWPNTGRIITAQLSVLLSLPLSCLLLKGLPTHDVGHRTAMRSLYALVMFLFGLCISW